MKIDKLSELTNQTFNNLEELKSFFDYDKTDDNFCELMEHLEILLEYLDRLQAGKEDIKDLRDEEIFYDYLNLPFLEEELLNNNNNIRSSVFY